MQTMQNRVRAGAEWLDQNYPNWFNVVDTSTLRMEDRKFCVLGQVTGGVYQYIAVAYDGRKPACWDIHNGFHINRGEDYHELKCAWLKEIQNRKDVNT